MRHVELLDRELVKVLREQLRPYGFAVRSSGCQRKYENGDGSIIVLLTSGTGYRNVLPIMAIHVRHIQFLVSQFREVKYRRLHRYTALCTFQAFPEAGSNNDWDVLELGDVQPVCEEISHRMLRHALPELERLREPSYLADLALGGGRPRMMISDPVARGTAIFAAGRVEEAKSYLETAIIRDMAGIGGGFVSGDALRRAREYVEKMALCEIEDPGTEA